jgi:hypothetical protein
MLATFAAALAIASSVPAIDVPFLPQTDALCGGAAAAMVLRYWGDRHADPQEFAPLIERYRGATGIADEVLVGAIGARGWQTDRLDGPAEQRMQALRASLAAREPVIVLLADRGEQFHYVVVVGAGADELVLHDPSWGPSRTIKEARFSDRWKRSAYWGLVIRPRAPSSLVPTEEATGDASDSSPAETTGFDASDSCSASVATAVDEVHSRGFTHADEILDSLQPRCVQSPAFLRELAGVRFAQERWHEAETTAREVLAKLPADPYATEVLGAARFMEDDAVGALRAWNAIGRPRLDLVRISGLTRTRYQAVAEGTGLKTGVVLTADAFLLASRRVEELPDRDSSRVSLHPEEDGFAAVDVAIAERQGVRRGRANWSAVAIRAAVEREVAVSLPGFTGNGEVWSASWRWWNNRPRVAMEFAVPAVGALSGVWRVDGSWEAETYTFGSNQLRETRTHGGLTVSDWVLPYVRYAVTGGLDSWNGGRRAASAGGTLEHRMFGDRLVLQAGGTIWGPLGSNAGSAFNSVVVRAHAGSRPAPERWAYGLNVGASRASDEAPFSIWNGAGEGRARPILLRAHPLLDDGIIDAGAASTFGRTLRYANAEGQRWLARPAIVRIGFAAFVDVAQASRRAVPGDSPVQTDVGGGVRLRIGGGQGMLRVDVAHGLRDGANAASIAWVVR